MGLFEHKLRIFFRSFFSPVDTVYASRWKGRLTVIYTLSACSLFIYSMTQLIVSRDADKELAITGGPIISPHDYAKKMRMYDAKIVYYDGFTRVKEESIKRSE